jgi:hypothetical protein
MVEPRVAVRVPVYEMDGSEAPIGTTLLIESHGTSLDRVVVYLDGHRLTVIASDLADAAHRAKKPR